MTLSSRILLIFILVFAAVSAAGQVVFMPSVIYARSDSLQRTVLYPEGFIGQKGVSFSINGARELVLTSGIDSVELCSGNYLRKVKVPLVITDTLPHNARARVLCFGESTTAIRCKDPYNPKSIGKNWVMLASCDLPEGVVLTGNIGHGGWATYTYLNWPCAAKLDPNAPDTFFRPETMWYALGLNSQTGEHYTGSVEQLSLMALTPFGKNLMDGSELLWKLVQRLGSVPGYPDFPYNEDYCGSEEQIRQLQIWAEELMENPINEFYDKKCARKGECAFSIKSYLKRSGEKRPTHVVVNLGINDADGANSFESSRLCYERLMKCLGDVPIAHFVNRWPGVCNRKLWREYLPRQYEINGNTFNLLCLQKEWRTVASEHPNIYELGVWHCQYPASQLEEKLISGGVLDCSLNDVHTGYMGEVSTAWQVVCWLSYILSKK